MVLLLFFYIYTRWYVYETYTCLHCAVAYKNKENSFIINYPDFITSGHYYQL